MELAKIGTRKVATVGREAGLVEVSRIMREAHVGDVMTPTLFTVNQRDSLMRVIDLMKERGVKRIPIVGDEFELVGIVAVEDIMMFLSKEISALAEVSQRQRSHERETRKKLVSPGL